MNYKIILSTIAFFLVLGLSLKSCNKILEDEEILESKSPSIIELDLFTSIDISIMTGDITIKKGDNYTLEYKLHPREEAKTAKVIDNTLYFISDFSHEYTDNWDNDLYDWYVYITLPENRKLENVNIVTVDGSINLSDFIIDKVELKTTDGEIRINNIEARDIKINSIAESVEVIDCEVDDLGISTISEFIYVDGNFTNVKLSNMSSRVRFTGNIDNSLDISTISGNIRVKIQENANISARTFKNIEFNELKRNFTFDYSPSKSLFSKKLPEITLNSTSGNIDIKTHEYIEKNK